MGKWPLKEQDESMDFSAMKLGSGPNKPGLRFYIATKLEETLTYKF